MSYLKAAIKENALVLTTPKRNELLKEGPPSESRRQILGRGAFGTVFKAVYRERPVAVKIMRNQNQSLHNETHVMHLKHNNIVSLIKVESTSEFALIIMERPIGQCLQRVLDTLTLPLAHRIFITLDILAALRYCHHQNLLHLDVKPSNILVALGINTNDIEQWCENYKRRYTCKLCDFGSSIRLGKTCARQCSAKGTLRYMSPEALRSAPLTCASDIYSLGITMWQLQSRRLPYHTLQCNESIAYQVVKHDLRPDDQAQLEALKLGSVFINASPHTSCYCAGRAIDWDSNTMVILRNYINDSESDDVPVHNLYKKVDVLARRNLSFESKNDRASKPALAPGSNAGCRKQRRLTRFFDNPMSTGSVRFENEYIELYKSCWTSEPDLRLNSLELQTRLKHILAKCVATDLNSEPI
ncbi:dual specificity protein kinase shkE [Scaptodrosophila lebanonensis]|uniref:non-specific serine/threonine protein kinase n=1 Tax=Drosophila lebanonensis TaxID=7225 RepID=A0A6J2UIU8_DROLE|nr:dual specificity protein kinase shkE [Scaptodrosophila lebanonensis]